MLNILRMTCSRCHSIRAGRSQLWFLAAISINKHICRNIEAIKKTRSYSKEYRLILFMNMEKIKSSWRCIPSTYYSLTILNMWGLYKTSIKTILESIGLARCLVSIDSSSRSSFAQALRLSTWSTFRQAIWSLLSKQVQEQCSHNNLPFSWKIKLQPACTLLIEDLTSRTKSTISGMWCDLGMTS